MTAKDLKVAIKFKPYPKWIFRLATYACWFLKIEPRLWMFGKVEVL